MDNLKKKNYAPMFTVTKNGGCVLHFCAISHLSVIAHLVACAEFCSFSFQRRSLLNLIYLFKVYLMTLSVCLRLGVYNPEQRTRKRLKGSNRDAVSYIISEFSRTNFEKHYP